MAKSDIKAELTKLQSVLSKNNRLRLEFLGQTSTLLRQHGVGISDELLSSLTLASKGEDDKAPSKTPPKGAKAVGGPPKPPPVVPPVGGPPKPPPVVPPVGGSPKPPPVVAAKAPKAKKPAAKTPAKPAAKPAAKSAAKKK